MEHGIQSGDTGKYKYRYVHFFTDFIQREPDLEITAGEYRVGEYFFLVIGEVQVAYFRE